VDTELTRRGILEALLFVAEEPLPLARLQEVLGDAEPGATEAAVRELALALDQEGRGLMVQEVAGGFRLTTRPEADPWVQRLIEVRPARLSRPALETLAIIAYRQPITRAEIEQVRGVAVDGVLRTLLERDLIRILGRKADAGRPIVYGTSGAFLEHFGFKDLGDLPTLKEIDELLGPSGAEPGAAGTVVPGPAAVAAQSEDALLDAPALGAAGSGSGSGAGSAAPDAGGQPASPSVVLDSPDAAQRAIRGPAQAAASDSTGTAGESSGGSGGDARPDSGAPDRTAPEPAAGEPAALAASPEPGRTAPEPGEAAGGAEARDPAGPSQG